MDFYYLLIQAIGFIGTKDGWCNADDVVELAKERDILIYRHQSI